MNFITILDTAVANYEMVANIAGSMDTNSVSNYWFESLYNEAYNVNYNVDLSAPRVDALMAMNHPLALRAAGKHERLRQSGRTIISVIRDIERAKGLPARAPFPRRGPM